MSVQPLSRLVHLVSHAHEGTKGVGRWPRGKATGSFMPVPQKKNYLGRSVILRGVRACTLSLKVVTNLEREIPRGLKRKPNKIEREEGRRSRERERDAKKRDASLGERRRGVDLLSRRHRGG